MLVSLLTIPQIKQQVIARESELQKRQSQDWKRQVSKCNSPYSHRSSLCRSWKMHQQKRGNFWMKLRQSQGIEISVSRKRKVRCRRSGNCYSPSRHCSLCLVWIRERHQEVLISEMTPLQRRAYRTKQASHVDQVELNEV